MSTYTVISQDTFNDIQMDAGVLLKQFDPANPGAPADEDIITATTGGINISAVPTISDFGEDIDNCPNRTKELQHLDYWDIKATTTAIGTSAAAIRFALGAADIDSESGKITPRRKIEQSDFADLWWVGDKSDGGFIAIRILNALSTDGFTLQTTKNGKGQVSIGISGHVSLAAQDVMPIEIYSIDAEDEDIEYTYTAVTPAGTENPAEEGWYVLVGDKYRQTTDATVDANVTYYERATA